MTLVNIDVWTKSSRSCGGDCVEVMWRKSSRSLDTNACVETAQADDTMLVRDSKDPDGAILRFTTAEWNAFVAGVRAGEFDL